MYCLSFHSVVQVVRRRRLASTRAVQSVHISLAQGRGTSAHTETGFAIWEPKYICTAWVTCTVESGFETTPEIIPPQK